MKKYLWDVVVYFYLRHKGVEFSFRKVRCIGLPAIRRCKDSRIVIEDDTTLDSGETNNVFGINHKVILATVAPGAMIHLKKGSGVSGSSIVSASRIVIGENSGLGGNACLYDTDFHPIDPDKRRLQRSLAEALTEPIEIGNDVLVGGGSIVLKGVSIGNGAFIGAHSVVTKNIPSMEIWAGNPAKFKSVIK